MQQNVSPLGMSHGSLKMLQRQVSKGSPDEKEQRELELKLLRKDRSPSTMEEKKKANDRIPGYPRLQITIEPRQQLLMNKFDKTSSL